MSSEISSHSEIKVGSERNFGLVFSTVFLIIAVWPVFFNGSFRIWSLVIAGIFAGLSLIYPSSLRYLNLLWFKFGLLLGKFITPIVMALLFLTAFVPVALFLRIVRKDTLNLKIDNSRSSYWNLRNKDDESESNSSMKNQF